MEETNASLFGGIFGIIYLLVFVLLIVSIWKIFTKAGKPGWAAIIPIYNVIVMLEIVGRPIWWIILLFIPIANLVVAILLAVDLAKAFGKGIGTAIGLILLPIIFYPILGLGSATYQRA
jgi:hypothetical protein